MAMKIKRGRRDDDRVQRILSDPTGYFARARREAQEEVKREMANEKRRPRRGLNPT